MLYEQKLNAELIRKNNLGGVVDFNNFNQGSLFAFTQPSFFPLVLFSKKSFAKYFHLKKLFLWAFQKRSNINLFIFSKQDIKRYESDARVSFTSGNTKLKKEILVSEMICKVKPPHQEILTEALLALEKDRAKVQVKIVLYWTSW